MGLQKTKIAATGQSGNYWHIRSLGELNFYDKVTTINLALYKDRAGMVAGDAPMEMYSMNLPQADWAANLAPDVLDKAGVNLRKKLYPWVKANSRTMIAFDLSDATNVPVGMEAD